MINHENFQWAALAFIGTAAGLVIWSFFGGLTLWAPYFSYAVAAAISIWGARLGTPDQGWGWLAVIVVGVPVGIFVLALSAPVWIGNDWPGLGKALYSLAAAGLSVGIPYLLKWAG